MSNRQKDKSPGGERSPAERLGADRLTRRRELQGSGRMRLCGARQVRVSLRTIRFLHRTIHCILCALGLNRPGRRNAFDLRVEETTLSFPDLPPAFDGYRILHISDIHIDSSPGLLEVLLEKISELEFDVCVFTGDYREEAAGHVDAPIQLIGRLLRGINAPVYGVLGNHDSIEMVPRLEKEGLQMLLNESAALHCGKDFLYLAGVDDPYHYQTDHLEKALEQVPDDGFCILLVHSPDLSRQAADAGVNLYLCGHTHGGQICLPNGKPLVANSCCPADLCRGSWICGNMQGYTSRGAGTSSVDVRFNCPPEITVHKLETA